MGNEGMGIVREGKAKITVPEGVFFNPEMELCRDMFSICLGCLPGTHSLADAMCASGVRGIRYKLENANIGKLALCDMSQKAVAAARKNAAANKVKAACVKGDARDFLAKNSFDILEIDPFGSPQPFLAYAARSFSQMKGGYLSVTATDMAVLCGAHHAACLKNYASAPLDNEFCHENACRILAAAAIRSFACEGIAAVPIFTFSHRHYVKLLFSLTRNAEGAVAQMKKLGYVSYCPSCCFRQASRLPLAKGCPHCKANLLHAGPLYTGGIWDSALVERMKKENASRGYKNAARIDKMLAAIFQESKIAAIGYYDLHKIAKKWGGKILSIDDALSRLRGAGFSAERTHFCPTALRTDAPHWKIRERLS